MTYDAKWLKELPCEAQFTAMHLRGLALLCAGWAEYRYGVGDPGQEGEGDVMSVLQWALMELARPLSPPEPPEPEPAELRDPDRAP